MAGPVTDTVVISAFCPDCPDGIGEELSREVVDEVVSITFVCTTCENQWAKEL